MTTTSRTSVPRAALALLLWAWYTALALVVASPYFAWLSAATGVAPETDVLLDGVQFGALFELLQASDGAFGLLTAAMAVAAALALLSNAFLSGGLFAVAVAPGEGHVLAGFFQAAGRFFFRSLGLLVLSLVAAIAVGGIVAAGGAAVLGALLPEGERADAAQAAFVMLLLGVAAAYFLLALDYARVWMVRHDAPGAIRTWLRGAWFVLRHPVKAAAPGVVFGLGIVATLALGAWVAGAAGSRTWGVIVGVLLAQQALLYLRVLLRVWMVAAEGNVGARGWGLGASAPSAPAPAAPPAPAPPAPAAP